MIQENNWWKNAVFYQIYPRSFNDANNDGVGDLRGIIQKIGYLELLGIDAIWLSPITKSPQADHGYDVSDPRDIDPLFGTIEDFEELIEVAHGREIKIIMDLVPNHTSIERDWFKEALSSPVGSPARARYIFKDGKGIDGNEPPNNWPSIFGGPAWTRTTNPDGTAGQWYLHLFAPEQPDLNWENPEVFSDLENTLEFWLDKGIDGFRIDVAHGMAKPYGLPDIHDVQGFLLDNADDNVRFNQPAVHDIHRGIRRIVNKYPNKVCVGEIWNNDTVSFSQYIRPDELHLAFNFKLAQVKFEVEEIKKAIDESIESTSLVDASPTWTLSNHDIPREVTRYSTAPDNPKAPLIGIAKAKAMFLLEMALPGSIFIYNGSELGLPNVDLPDSALQDPAWERSGHTNRGRDGERVPLPWEGTSAPFGFSKNPDTWLPMPSFFKHYTAEEQIENVYSMFSLYRAAIEVRKLYGETKLSNEIEWFVAPENCLAFRVKGGAITIAINASDEPIAMPPGTVIIASGPLGQEQLPPYTTVWLK